MKPSLATEATIMMAATRIASIDARATARPGSPSAATSGSTVAAIIGPSDESGPSTRIRDGPNTAYPSRHMIDVYRPVIGGRPASSAYAMPCGTRTAVSTMPATTSFASHRERYDRTARTPGTAPTMASPHDGGMPRDSGQVDLAHPAVPSPT